MMACKVVECGWRIAYNSYAVMLGQGIIIIYRRHQNLGEFLLCLPAWPRVARDWSSGFAAPCSWCLFCIRMLKLLSALMLTAYTQHTRTSYQQNGTIIRHRHHLNMRTVKQNAALNAAKGRGSGIMIMARMRRFATHSANTISNKYYYISIDAYAYTYDAHMLNMHVYIHIDRTYAQLEYMVYVRITVLVGSMYPEIYTHKKATVLPLSVSLTRNAIASYALACRLPYTTILYIYTNQSTPILTSIRCRICPASRAIAP